MATRAGYFRKIGVKLEDGQTPGLLPHDPHTREWMESITNGTIIKAGSITMPRNYKFHCKFFAMLGVIHKHQSRYATIDDLLFAFKAWIGHGHMVETNSGQLWKPHSISFAKMDEAAFNEFYKKALEFVVEQIVPNTTVEELQQGLLEFA